MKDNGVGDEELLVARSNKRCRKICGEIQYVPKDEKQDGIASRKAEVK